MKRGGVSAQRESMRADVKSVEERIDIDDEQNHHRRRDERDRRATVSPLRRDHGETLSSVGRKG
jgi:hypothetical protein